MAQLFIYLNTLRRELFQHLDDSLGTRIRNAMKSLRDLDAEIDNEQEDAEIIFGLIIAEIWMAHAYSKT